MRTLQTQEVKTVSGAGVLTNVVDTTVAAGTAAGTGLVQAGVILGKPVATGIVNVLKFLI